MWVTGSGGHSICGSLGPEDTVCVGRWVQRTLCLWVTGPRGHSVCGSLGAPTDPYKVTFATSDSDWEWSPSSRPGVVLVLWTGSGHHRLDRV